MPLIVAAAGILTIERSKLSWRVGLISQLASTASCMQHLEEGSQPFQSLPSSRLLFMP